MLPAWWSIRGIEGAYSGGESSIKAAGTMLHPPTPQSTRVEGVALHGSGVKGSRVPSHGGCRDWCSRCKVVVWRSSGRPTCVSFNSIANADL